MFAYAIFASGEYTDDAFFGAWSDYEEALRQIDRLRADPTAEYYSVFTLKTLDLRTGETASQLEFDPLPLE